MTDCYLKKQTKKKFEELFKDYLYVDALQFGRERLEIKATKLHLVKGAPTCEFLMFVIPTTVDENESVNFDWEHPTIRPYDNKKDW